MVIVSILQIEESRQAIEAEFACGDMLRVPIPAARGSLLFIS